MSRKYPGMLTVLASGNLEVTQRRIVWELGTTS